MDDLRYSGRLREDEVKLDVDGEAGVKVEKSSDELDILEKQSDSRLARSAATRVQTERRGSVVWNEGYVGERHVDANDKRERVI